MMHPIAAVVLPLKDAAIARAEAKAREIVTKIEAELAAVDFDANIAAPYPKSKMDRNSYMQGKRRYDMFRSLTTRDSTRGKISRSWNDPEYVVMAPEKIEHFFAMTRAEAAAQYDAFVMKLIAKIGDVETADLTGEHVWGYSILTVTKKDGTIEKWKTQMIVNISKLGLVFNQWPSRKMKG